MRSCDTFTTEDTESKRGHGGCNLMRSGDVFAYEGTE